MAEKPTAVMVSDRLSAAGFACVTLLLWASVVSSDDTVVQDASALVKRVIEVRPRVAFEADGLLTAPGGFTRELRLFYKPMDDVDATYMEVTAPLNVKNTRFLFLERKRETDEQHMYVPALKRTIQILDETRDQPFLGSDFYVADLLSPDFDAYEYEFAEVADAEVGGRRCKIVESTPKSPANAAHAKIVLAIDPVDFLVMRSEFFDSDGSATKIWTLERVEKISGYWTPLLQKMTTVRRSTESTFETRHVAYEVEIPDSVFSKAHLER